MNPLEVGRRKAMNCALEECCQAYSYRPTNSQQITFTPLFGIKTAPFHIKIKLPRRCQADKLPSLSKFSKTPKQCQTTNER
jgi:hypothetical protein